MHRLVEELDEELEFLGRDLAIGDDEGHDDHARGGFGLGIEGVDEGIHAGDEFGIGPTVGGRVEFLGGQGEGEHLVPEVVFLWVEGTVGGNAKADEEEGERDEGLAGDAEVL